MPTDPKRHPEGKRLVDEQRAETAFSGTVGGPTTPAMTDSMARGMWRGGLIGALVGAVLMTPVAFIDFFDMELWGRLIVVWVAGFAAGAAFGGVFFGGAVAESESEDSHDEGIVPEQMHRDPDELQRWMDDEERRTR